MVILEFSMPTGWFRPIYRLYLRSVIPAVSCFLSDRSAYEYLGDSIEKFYTPSAFRDLLHHAGFAAIRQIPLSLVPYMRTVRKNRSRREQKNHNEVQ